ncbi:MAG: hypothetical protein D6692_00145, partial [Planctomycetota bacterium]
MRTPATLFIAALTAAASAQATNPHIFVANDGNLEGSVSSMRIEPDGSLTLVDRVITGTRTSTSQPCPGCNTYAIDLSPDGRFLATNHAAGDTGEQVTIYSVSQNGTLAVVDVLPLAQGGLDIAWVRDDLLAVCITNLSGSNLLRLYNWNDQTNQLSLADSDSAGSFLTSIVVHPNGQWIYCNDSFGFTVRQFEVSGSSATLVDTVSIPVYGVAISVSPDGRFLYAAGGISAGGNAFAGYTIDQSTGALTAMPGSPFTSPGQSPKGFTMTPDGQYLYVSHGTDATIRAFSVDPESGVPTSLGLSFDVGLQGTLQGMDTLPGFLFALDESTAIDGIAGAYTFAIDPNTGAFPPVPGAPVLTGGISPTDVVAWPGAACPADLAAPFGTLNIFDIQAYIALYNTQDPAADLAEPFGTFNIFDIQAYI